MASDSRDVLTLKVMRLSQPSINAEPWPLLRIDEVTSEDQSIEKKVERAKDCVERALDSTHALLLPATQGRIFSGETFSAYINISNSSNAQAVNVIIQVELSIGQKRDLLFDNSQDPIRCLNPGNSFDCTIVHELKEPGTYTLVCAVSHYLSAVGEQKSFKKSFKFAAHPPFRVGHRVVLLQGRAFVECSLDNVSQQPVYLSDASIFCVEGIEGVRLDSGPPCDSMNHKGLHYFKPQDRYNLVFSLTPTATRLGVDASFIRRLPVLGQLALEWRTSTGGAGCMHDYTLTNSLAGSAKPLSLRVVSCPASVQVESPFQVEIEVSAHIEQVFCPVLILRPSDLQPFVIQGSTTRPLGIIDMLTPRRYTLEAVCLSPGFHSVKGIMVYDPDTHQTADAAETLCQVLAF
uniref:Uncharacterized protein n=1 Tax=Neospora caninum (strain Liverpool) TaxID=572307 RepID=A0A0F7UDP7_NEOCL|nr:TPA: hypothetical protein BN1204_029940 [Neospora caninum Liverpool]